MQFKNSRMEISLAVFVLIILYKNQSHSFSQILQMLQESLKLFQNVSDNKILKQEFWPKGILKCQDFLCWKQCKYDLYCIEQRLSITFCNAHYLRKTDI